MKLYTKIHVVIAFIMIVFECITFQVAYNSIEKFDIENIVMTGFIGFGIYLAIVLVLIIGKNIFTSYKHHKLKEKIINCSITVSIIGVILLIYQIGYQIAIVIGADKNTAESWPLLVFCLLIFLFGLYIPLEKFVFWINGIKK